jgi:hypothetical protein
MVEFDVRASFAKIAEATKIVTGTEAGECQEIAYQVRLIKITVFQSELCPIRRRDSVRQRQYSLKSLNPIKNFRFKPYFESEGVDKSLVTQASVSSQLTNHCTQIVQTKTF